MKIADPFSGPGPRPLEIYEAETGTSKIQWPRPRQFWRPRSTQSPRLVKIWHVCSDAQSQVTITNMGTDRATHVVWRVPGAGRDLYNRCRRTSGKVDTIHFVRYNTEQVPPTFPII